MTKDIIDATEEALRKVVDPRFFQTERGFQGQFYCALQRQLEEKGLLKGGYLLEMEYQKSRRHGITQRPDIILHVPAEVSGAQVIQNNLAVWALKKRATEEEAEQDFFRLDEMFDVLHYPLGFLVNIDAKNNFASSYQGRFPGRLRTVAVWLESTVMTAWGRPQANRPARRGKAGADLRRSARRSRT